jgi:alpha-glucoside transport system permease protein
VKSVRAAKVRPPRLASLLAQLLLAAVVLLWVLPTFGLLVSSLRDENQLLTSGWWRALLPNDRNETARLPLPEAQTQVVLEGRTLYLIRGNLFSDQPGRILSFSDSATDIDRYRPGERYTPRAGGELSVEANGDYAWQSATPFEHSRGPRVFYSARFAPRFTLQHYWDVMTLNDGLAKPFVNTLSVALPATIIPITIAAFAAYAFSWMRFPGRLWLLMGVVALLVVPLQLSLIPVLRLYNGIANLFDGQGKTYLGIWLAHTGFGLPLAIYLLRNYMRNLPQEIMESARVDGATHFQIFVRIVLPLSVPALASFAIFQFLWVWNDLLVSLVFLSSQEAVMTNQIVSLLGSRGNDWHLLTAGAFISIALPLFVFLALQRYFVRGLLAGSVKGG